MLFISIDDQYRDKGRVIIREAESEAADKRFTIYEFALLTILQEHLGEDISKEVPIKYYKFKDVEDEIELLLSVTVRTGTSSEELVRLSYQKIMKQFTPEEKDPKQKSECALSALNSALHKLNRLKPLLKQSVINDGKVLPREAELLQAIAVSLDCPMPPLLD
jgi:hypothetical protein